MLPPELRSRAFWEGQALGVGAVLAATMLRQLMSPLVYDEMPHIPYLAAVLVVALRSGFAAAVTATLSGGMAANWVFIGDYGRLAFDADDLWASAFFVLFGLAVANIASRLRVALQSEAQMAARLALVNSELQHRIKNMVAVTQSIISQSARTAASADELKSKVENRLHAMSHALQLLVLTEDAVSLRQLLGRVLEPFAAEHKVEIVGPEVRISGEQAVQLALLFHELATNAAKYGALSAPGGAVRVRWRRCGDCIQLDWTEEGGPPVKEPQRNGFGSRLLRAAVPDGKLSMQYLSTGVVCSLELGLANVN